MNQVPGAPQQTPEEYLKSVAQQLATTVAARGDGIPGRVAADSQLLTRLGIGVPLAAARPDDVAFRPLLAESLLRDACILLDRALRFRAEAEDSATKFFEASVQIEELLTLNDISLLEEAQYDVPESADKFEQDGEFGAFGGFKTAQSRLQAVLDGADPNFTQAQMNAYWNAMKPEVAAGARQLLTAQVSQMDAQSYAAKGRSDATFAMRGYKAQMQSYQKQRNSAARLSATRRALALTQADGVLRYDQRSRSATARFTEDFGSALARLVVAAAGLKTLYGYATALPVVNGTYDFDDVYLWCQKTTTWLAALTDNQQLATFSFGLTALLGGPRAFNNGRAAGKWDFVLPDDAFGDRRCIRIRSLAAQVVSNKPYGSWSLTLAPPASGSYRTLEGVLMPGGLSNGTMPTLVLGRVVADRSSLPGESIAGPLVQNTTPLGKWSLQMDLQSSALVPLSEVLDVTLHLTVAYF